MLQRMINHCDKETILVTMYMDKQINGPTDGQTS